MNCKTMEQDENDQNHKKDSTPVMDNKPNGKSQLKTVSELPIGSERLKWSREALRQKEKTFEASNMRFP